MKNKILEEIDKLKMMVMLDMGEPEKTEAEKYEAWVKEMQGYREPRCWRTHDPFDKCGICTVNPKKWIEYNTLYSLVENLFHDIYGDLETYYKNKMDVQKIIREAVAMTLYIQEKV